MTTSTLDSGHSIFFKNWLTHPFATAAQVPSSRALADEMARATLHGAAGPVVEFGPGTGSITESLMDYGVEASDLVLIEQNPDFCQFLKHRYGQGLTIIQADAFTAVRDLKGIEARGVLSGMPLVQFPKPHRLRFVHQCLNYLARDTGRFSQFTYGYGTPVPLGAKSGIEAHCSKRIWWNLWPAVVWTYHRSQAKG